MGPKQKAADKKEQAEERANLKAQVRIVTSLTFSQKRIVEIQGSCNPLLPGKI